LELEGARIVRPTDAGRALLGCWVEFREDDDEAESWLLVPPSESDPREGCLDVDTPFGRALYGRQVGDRVVVEGPGDRHVIEIVAIEVD
jgi:transcription elongation GreA/GreB family factor